MLEINDVVRSNSWFLLVFKKETQSSVNTLTPLSHFVAAAIPLLSTPLPAIPLLLVDLVPFNVG